MHARAAAATAVIGTSSCTSTASPGANASPGTVTAAFAPGHTLIWFSPDASMPMSATPVGSSTVRTADTSTPAATRVSRASAPSASSPTAPIMRVATPSAAAAAA